MYLATGTRRMPVSVSAAFFDTNVLVYIASGDVAKADRAEAIVAAGGACATIFSFSAPLGPAYKAQAHDWRGVFGAPKSNANEDAKTCRNWSQIRYRCRLCRNSHSTAPAGFDVTS